MTPRAELERLIEAERDRLIEFLQGFVRIDTSNPPGDTRAGADYVARFLDREDLPYRVIAPQADKPNDEFLHVVRTHALSAFDYLR